MKTRFALSGVVVAAAFLAACGGGGGGGGITPPSTTPTPVSTPTPIPSFTPSFTYSGTYTRNDTYTYGNPTVEPSSNVTANVTEKAGPYGISNTVNGAGGSDTRVIESDAYPQYTDTTTTDNWLTSSGASASLVASKAVIGSGSTASTMQTSYGNPQLLVSAQSSWSNNPAATITEQFPFSSTLGNRVIYSDGTYSESLPVAGVTGMPVATIHITGPAIDQVPANGSGYYAGPFFGGAVKKITFSAPGVPSPMPSPAVTPPVVTATLIFAAPGPSATPPPPQSVYDPPFWGTGTPVFYHETDTAQAGAAFPPACSAQSYASSGEHIQRTISTLDTVIGYLETTTLDTYFDSSTPVCIVLNDVQNIAYDYSGDTIYSFVFGGPNDHVVTINEAVTLDAGATIQSQSRRTAAASSSFAEGNAFAAAIESHFLARVAQRREQLVRRAIDGLAHRHGAFAQ